MSAKRKSKQTKIELEVSQLRGAIMKLQARTVSLERSRSEVIDYRRELLLMLDAIRRLGGTIDHAINAKGIERVLRQERWAARVRAMKSVVLRVTESGKERLVKLYE